MKVGENSSTRWNFNGISIGYFEVNLSILEVVKVFGLGENIWMGSWFDVDDDGFGANFVCFELFELLGCGDLQSKGSVWGEKNRVELI